MYDFLRDPRFNKETVGFLQEMAKNPPSKAGPPQVSDLRHHFEHLHEHANESLSGTFKGKLEQKTIKISSAGKFFNLEN